MACDVRVQIGMFSWFAVHPTNMNRSNTLVSADNKGLASVLFERCNFASNPAVACVIYDLRGCLWTQGAAASTRSPSQAATEAPFIAAFAQANQGDISPNVGESEPGALCVGGLNEGQPCEPLSSTCPDASGAPTVALCIARGPAPGGEIFGSSKHASKLPLLVVYRPILRDCSCVLPARIMAERQFAAAQEAWSATTELPHGRIGYVHQFVDMASVVIPGVGKSSPLCKPALLVMSRSSLTELFL